MSQLIALLQQFVNENNLTDDQILDLHGSVNWHDIDTDSPEDFVQHLKDVLKPAIVLHKFTGDLYYTDEHGDDHLVESGIELEAEDECAFNALVIRDFWEQTLYHDEAVPVVKCVFALDEPF